MVRPDFRNFQRSNELYHYGMPRRSGRYPWGSGKRPYQSVKDALEGEKRSDYFNSERTIPKGTKMFRTTVDPSPGLSNGHSVYVTYLDPDRDLYKGGYIRTRSRKDTAYEHEMILEKDLKIPSRETYKSTIKDVIDKNPDLLRDSVKGYFEQLIPENSWNRYRLTFDERTGKCDTSKWDAFINNRYDKIKDIPVLETWGEIARSLGRADKLKDAIINDLKNKGYNAIVDEAGVGGDGRPAEGIDPLIIFDSSVLRPNKTSEISRLEEQKSGKNYDEWLYKARASGNRNEW